MSADRELLELAAKACGYDTAHHWNAYRLTLNPPVESLCIGGVSTAWNPLRDDGHALRLAVKLGLSIQLGTYKVAVEFIPQEDGSSICVSEGYDNDEYAATRRAIVRAAAEIGRTK